MKKGFHTSLALASILSFSLFATAKAGVITEVDYFSSGDKAVTYVEDTGLNWLDLTYTLNMSVDAVSGDLTLGGLLDSSWRIATLVEVDSLFTAYGFTPDAGCSNGAKHCSPSGEKATSSVNMIWNMYAPGGSSMTGLFINPFLSSGLVGLAYTDHGNFGSPGSTVDARTDQVVASGYASRANTGVFLVQSIKTGTSVPTPHTLALIALGLFGVGIQRKYKVRRAY